MIQQNYADESEIVSDFCKAHKICNKVASNDAFKIKYFLDRYKTQKTCHEAVDDCQH